MNQNELVSIILPVYNGEEFLEDTINSCLAQTYKAIELIIVNDCSVDNSLKIAEEYSKRDPRIRVISNKKNKKLPASLNIGHRAATGNVITWISDDNVFEPTAIGELYEILKNSGKDIIYSNFIKIDQEGTFKGVVKLDHKNTLLLGNTIGASFIYRKEVFDRNRGYDEELHTVEDFDFWLRASIHSSFHHTPQVLYKYRSHSNSLSSQVNKDRVIDQQFNERLEIAYKNFFSELGIAQDSQYASLFFNFHRFKEINVLGFLKDYKGFLDTLKLISQNMKLSDYDTNLCSIDLRIRANIQQYVSNQNVEVMFQLLLQRPQILLNYNRRNSLKIIAKCLKSPLSCFPTKGLADLTITEWKEKERH